MSFAWVVPHFAQFLDRIQLTPTQRADAEGKAAHLARTLHRHYRPSERIDGSDYLIVGSYGKHTAVRPPSDVDMLYKLPIDAYVRYRDRNGNRQSGLLQEVRNVLLPSFPGTAIRADGPVVSVPFASYKMEILPSFELDAETFMICDTKAGGRWKFTHPYAQARAIAAMDRVSAGKATHLIQMTKVWKRTTGALVKHYALEMLALEFLSQWEHLGQSMLYYDLMVRDFFGWLPAQANRLLYPPSDTDPVHVGDPWVYRAQIAHNNARMACSLEVSVQPYRARWSGSEWFCKLVA